MTAQELNEKKWKEISPLINELVYEFEYKKISNHYEYIKTSWGKLKSLLESYNLPDNTFKELNVRYRNEIEKRILEKVNK